MFLLYGLQPFRKEGRDARKSDKPSRKKFSASFDEDKTFRTLQVIPQTTHITF
jgi:hypothetical protein